MAHEVHLPWWGSPKSEDSTSVRGYRDQCSQRLREGGPARRERQLSRKEWLVRGKKIPPSTKTRHSVKCLLADRTRMDCQLLAASLQRVKGHCKVVGTASSVAEARKVMALHHPDVALVSPHLSEGPLAGFDLVQGMRDSAPDTRVIMLLDSMEPRMVIYSFQVGAKGVFSRDRSVDDLAKCLEVVNSGQIWAGTTELQIILQAMAKRTHFEPVSATGIKLLTGREAEVAALVAEGLRNREISERLNLSAHTVKNYLYRVYEKLGISSRVELTTHVLAGSRVEPETEAPPDRRMAG
jgi:two-component system nitrate/nitrite response regulator NarL